MYNTVPGNSNGAIIVEGVSLEASNRVINGIGVIW
jgi:hypothetical protein